MIKKKLVTLFITQSGQATEAELRWRTIERTDVDTLTVALDNMPNQPLEATGVSTRDWPWSFRFAPSVLAGASADR